MKTESLEISLEDLNGKIDDLSFKTDERLDLVDFKSRRSMPSPLTSRRTGPILKRIMASIWSKRVDGVDQRRR